MVDSKLGTNLDQKSKRRANISPPNDKDFMVRGDQNYVTYTMSLTMITLAVGEAKYMLLNKKKKRKLINQLSHPTLLHCWYEWHSLWIGLHRGKCQTIIKTE